MIIGASILSGIILLYLGANWLVKGSSAIALRSGVSSLIVGLTIVAFGTSTPELLVSLRSALTGLPDLAITNVVGSNIFNIAVILGLSALFRPLRVNLQVLRIDVPLMALATLLLWILLRDNSIGRIEGLFLFLSVLFYTFLTVFLSKKNAPLTQSVSNSRGETKPQKAVAIDISLVFLGLGFLMAGARFFVSGSIDLAKVLSVPEGVIGLTIVAAGTSLPELATSIVAALKGEEDIAIGNIIGSNIFNILCILGLTGVIQPLHTAGVDKVVMGFMLGTAVFLLPLMKTGIRIVRAEGFLLLGIYGVYLWYLWP
ncbi:calcium/sodium antiporter [Oceanispirochaeta sp.]|jgi:cation:H+ antiporter|uniref:calcium/sodium antiporter n=1 Tax=Oceanispirochaeta sp. TaxID=2035350 RepID=UPI00260E4EB3|nr:calcium/sodium antiporter [Oceanispirochaeta sp.]MDA3957351.1 calcium/sodium antiporter [Oceanispirochaeta sp.]